MNFLIRIGLVLGLGFNLGFCESLMVASWPIIDATLYINGKMVGETPFNTTIKPGTYTLKVEKGGLIKEREIVVKKGDEYVFVNIFMQREGGKEETKIPPPEIEKIEITKPETKVFETAKIHKIEPEKEVVEKEEITKPETKVFETAKIHKIEPEKIVEEKKKEETNMLILKTSSLIEEVEEEGGKRYAKERLKHAKRLLHEAKTKNSYSLAEASYKEAELALKETREKISYYSSSYIMGIVKHIGK